MISIDNVLISDEVIEAKFVCDLHKCKGGCCEDGDAGAPLEQEDIQVDLRPPTGMPVSRPLGSGLHEVRTSLDRNRIARVIFYIDRQSRMVLLHAFIKKTAATAAHDLELARRNKAKHERGLL